MRRALSPGTTRIFFKNNNTEKTTATWYTTRALLPGTTRTWKNKTQKNNCYLVYDESLIARDYELVWVGIVVVYRLERPLCACAWVWGIHLNLCICIFKFMYTYIVYRLERPLCTCACVWGVHINLCGVYILILCICISCNKFMRVYRARIWTPAVRVWVGIYLSLCICIFKFMYM